MPFAPLPPSAAWAHRDSRDGFEVVYCVTADAGHLLSGTTTAVEAGRSWVVAYDIRVDTRWRTRSARVSGRSSDGVRERLLESDTEGHWRVDGRPAHHLDGCLDVDLESSAMTNTLPVHRLALVPGEAAQAPAVYVRAVGLDVERLDQRYARVGDEGAHSCYDYVAPAFDFSCRLMYDVAGLVVTYPGIAERAC
jgi:hypothetical protein